MRHDVVATGFRRLANANGEEMRVCVPTFINTREMVQLLHSIYVESLHE
jgi:hypothetical protein